MRRLIAASALLLLLAGCGRTAQPGLTVRIDRSSFRISVLRDGKTVVAEDPHARLRYQLTASGDQHFLGKVISSHGDIYQVATNEPGRTATVTVTPRADGVRIEMELHPAAGVQQVYDAFDTSPGEHFLGGGERGEGPDLNGEILSVKVGTECSYAPIPFFSSSAGWAVRLASRNVAALAFPGSPGGGGCLNGEEQACTFPQLVDRAEVCVQGTTLDEDVYTGSLSQTLADYEADTGRPVVPPPSLLTLIKWRDVVANPGQVLEDVTRLQQAGIPLGWVELDNPWEPCNGALTFDRARIPHPRKLIDQVHARDVRFMLWVSPRETCPDGIPRGDLIESALGAILDLRKPAAAAELEMRLRRLDALGVDGFKADRGDEIDLQPVAAGLDNEYPLLYAHAVLAALPKGGAAIFRAATSGSQAVAPALWAGDQPQAWVGLQRAIVDGETASMSGFTTWGSDVGGYNASPGDTPELFVRWAQLGAVSPLMEVGGAGANATPWVLGAEAMDGLRQAVILHYELFPYLYGLLRRHEPVLRPLGYGFPDDPGSWATSYEFLVGPDLLAAPVSGPGESPSVYLPPGSWVDLFTGAMVRGGGPAFTRATPLLQFPLYARAGAVVPFDLRTATGSWWGLDELAHPGRAGFLATDGAELALSGQPKQVQLFVPAPSRPREVTLGGREVAWSWNTGPLPGVVVRLHGPAIRGRIVLSSS
jgi:alpha-glucosidase (family GH31 glycosyl hydrolase)